MRNLTIVDYSKRCITTLHPVLSCSVGIRTIRFPSRGNHIFKHWKSFFQAVEILPLNSGWNTQRQKSPPDFSRNGARGRWFQHQKACQEEAHPMAAPLDLHTKKRGAKGFCLLLPTLLSGKCVPKVTYYNLLSCTVKWRMSGASHSMATPRVTDWRRS